MVEEYPSTKLKYIYHFSGRIEITSWERDEARIKAKRDPKKRFHEINIKGNFNKAFHDKQLNLSYQDLTYGNGRIYFTGSWDEYDNYIDWLIDNEGSLRFKII